MYNSPSRERRRIKKQVKGPSIVTLLDATFIFQFFLIYSATFVLVNQIPTNAPIVEERVSRPNEKPLALTVKIVKDAIEVYTSVPSRLVKRLPALPEGQDLIGLHETLIDIKKQYPNDNTAILSPDLDISYEDIIKVVDSIRMLENTDEDFYIKDQDGIDVKAKNLFADVLFGNIQG